jgi:thiol-disulfide isomerase/thioredoxin
MEINRALRGLPTVVGQATRSVFLLYFPLTISRSEACLRQTGEVYFYPISIVFLLDTSYLVLLSFYFLMIFRALLLILSFLVFSCQSKAPTESSSTAVADPFSLAEVRFQRMDGTEFGLSAEQKTYTVLHFWATWCKPCLAEFPELKAALPRLQGDSVAFFLATEEDLDQIRAFEEKRNFGLEFLQLKEATLADFEVHALPTTLVLDRQGKVIYRHMGQLNWQDVTSIEDLISQKP